MIAPFYLVLAVAFGGQGQQSIYVPFQTEQECSMAAESAIRYHEQETGSYWQDWAICVKTAPEMSVVRQNTIPFQHKTQK